MPIRRSRGRPAHPDVLTPAEWRVLDLVRHGLRRGEIAQRRGTSVDAVKYHLANITDKLGVRPADLRRWPGYPTSSPLAHGRDTTMPASLELRSLGQISMLARDAGRVEAFYRDLLGLPHVFTFGDLVFFQCGETRLFIRAVAEGEWQPSSILYFRVADIRAAHAALVEKGVTITSAPHLIHRHEDSGDEEWMAFFEDSEGNALAVMSRVPAAEDSTAEG